MFAQLEDNIGADSCYEQRYVHTCSGGIICFSSEGWSIRPGTVIMWYAWTRNFPPGHITPSGCINRYWPHDGGRGKGEGKGGGVVTLASHPMGE